MSFIAFPHIEGLKKLKHTLRNGYEDLPQRLRFRGTVKLHGTNAAIGQLVREGGLFPQSRSRLIEIDCDNHGFAAFVAAGSMGKTSKLQVLFERVRRLLPLEKAEGSVHLFGEWAGKGVQKAVAVSTMPKFFSIFAVWVDDAFVDMSTLQDIHDVDAGIYNVFQFGEYFAELDRFDVLSSTKELEKTTNDVSEACPAGLFLGTTGKGEGIVWTCLECPNDPNLWFKTKGKEFSSEAPAIRGNSSLETAASEFAAATLVPWRLEQAEAFAFEKTGCIKARIPLIIQWVVDDALREEGQDVPAESLPMFRRALQRIARAWAVERCRK